MKIRNPVGVIKQLKKKGIAFTIHQTLYTKKIITENKIYEHVAKTELKKSDLSFIRIVKLYCKKLNNIPFLESKDVHYIDKNILKSDIDFEKVFEIDLNSAFWEFAKLEKFIDEKIYLKGLTVPKKTRLVALGALAKKTAILKYDGKKYAPIEFIKSTDTQGVFFKVAQRTSYLMQELKFISGNDYLFFWCDAIFIKGEKAFLKCCEYLDGFDFKYKSYKIDNVRYTDGDIIVQSKDYSEKNNKKNHPRLFTFEKKKLMNNTYKYYEKKSSLKK